MCALTQIIPEAEGPKMKDKKVPRKEKTTYCYIKGFLSASQESYYHCRQHHIYERDTTFGFSFKKKINLKQMSSCQTKRPE